MLVFHVSGLVHIYTVSRKKALGDRATLVLHTSERVRLVHCLQKWRQVRQTQKKMVGEFSEANGTQVDVRGLFFLFV